MFSDPWVAVQLTMETISFKHFHNTHMVVSKEMGVYVYQIHLSKQLMNFSCFLKRFSVSILNFVIKHETKLCGFLNINYSEEGSNKSAILEIVL